MNTLLLLATLFAGAAYAFDEAVFRHEMLKLYNAAREAHEVPLVSLSTSISSQAKLWAEYLAIQPESKCLRHAKGGGDNLYFFWSSKPISEKVLALKTAHAFYREISYYNYNRPGFSFPSAHFTEMIWKSVKNIGIAAFEKKYTNSHGGCWVGGSSRSPAIGYMVVIKHDPKGNVSSKKAFQANVLKPIRAFRFM